MRLEGLYEKADLMLKEFGSVIHFSSLVVSVLKRSDSSPAFRRLATAQCAQQAGNSIADVAASGTAQSAEETRKSIADVFASGLFRAMTSQRVHAV